MVGHQLKCQALDLGLLDADSRPLVDDTQA